LVGSEARRINPVAPAFEVIPLAEIDFLTVFYRTIIKDPKQHKKGNLPHELRG
jgi:hypothetical protein